MKQLHPNAVIAFYLSSAIALLFFFGFMDFIIAIPLLAAAIEEGFFDAIFILLTIIVVTILASLTLPYPLALLSYQNYRYQLQDDQIVIERGIIWKRHVSIPYSRVQNLDIIRGPIARWLGLADIQIQTAGISGALLVEGRLPAISPQEAENVRNEILTKIKSTRQGL